ncbi:hypothetical protein GDO81_030046 [Engystomops pustulosus]|uniref:Uncharacterized protein n=1 Tax=Engystomops pustulosus TaxID=76066 RepID=A0AAV6ZL89_ENGPU|nr:hypothetical protein GDO81_030046 [Engystomops pustulosus]
METTMVYMSIGLWKMMDGPPGSQTVCMGELIEAGPQSPGERIYIYIHAMLLSYGRFGEGLDKLQASFTSDWT